MLSFFASKIPESIKPHDRWSQMLTSKIQQKEWAWIWKMIVFFLALTIQSTQCIVLELIRANVLCLKEELYPGSLLIGNFTLSPFGRTINFNVCVSDVQIRSLFVFVI
jgi:hypothetical protein